jgi:hypothetical protein
VFVAAVLGVAAMLLGRRRRQRARVAGRR